MTVAPLVLTRHFKASPERVFAAFIEKELMQGWFGPEWMTVPSCEVDARVGGRYRIEMHSADGAVHTVTGEFREIKAPERLVYTWAWLRGPGKSNESLVAITLRAKDGGTELTLEHSGLASEEIRVSHGKGWTSSWDCLDGLIAGAPKSTQATPIVVGVERSSNVQSVRIALFEKGVAHRVESVRPHTAQVLALNPFGKVPAFRCGAVKLYESAAIMHYVDEAFDGPALMPEGAAERAMADQWLGVLNSYAYPALIRNYVLRYFFPQGADGKPDRAAIEAGLPEIAKILDVFEAAYGGRDCLVGDRLCLADFALAPMIFNLALFPEGKSLVAARVNVGRAHEKFAARASFAAAIGAAR